MTDFHSHILPGIDDGSANVEQSVAMLRLEGEQGIGLVVATPHFHAQLDDPEAFLRRRAESEGLLRRELEKHPGLPDFITGAEVAFFRGMSEWEFLPELTIGDSGHILVEMPPAPWPEEYFRELEAIRMKRGICPVIAHIDRYIAPLRTFGLPGRLMRMPLLVQANSSFFLEKRTASMAMKMLKADQIHLLGSDCHNLTSRRPNLGAALKRIGEKLGPGGLNRIQEYERQILGSCPE